MTINNIFKKLETRVIEDLRLQQTKAADQNGDKDVACEATNFDYQATSEKMALLQLNFIKDKLEALHELV